MYGKCKKIICYGDYSDKGNIGMNFDVIIGNPPYQENTGGGVSINNENGNGAKALYHKFVELAWNLCRNGAVSFIIPARWFTGGQGLGNFTSEMLNNRHIKQITFYPNSKDIFPDNSIAGGIVYYTELRNIEFDTVKYRVISNGIEDTVSRKLNSYDVFIKDNIAIGILDKIKTTDTLDYLVGPVMQYNIPTYYRGTESGMGKKKCITSAGEFDYESDMDASSYRVFISNITNEHANMPGPDGKYKVLGKSGVLEPNVFCSASYITIGEFNDSVEALKLLRWVQSKLVRFILLQLMIGIHITKKSFRYVPMKPEKLEINWSDEDIYNYYGLTDTEIRYIEGMIRTY